MKQINIFLCISALFLVSCSGRINNFSSQKYTHYSKGSVAVNQESEKQIQNENVSKMEVLAASNMTTSELILDQPVILESPSAEKATLQNLDKAHFIAVWNNLEKQEKKEVIKTIKSTYKANKSENSKLAVDALELICAIFIPPLGVFLHEGGITSNFWIDLILTLLFWLPGMIFAILIVTDSI